ncbi:MAG: hypothetical protein GTO17_07325 [Candidatus Aminicenantes bacterium]|nr:hypothetical protein [Candidatus Aminicenantes bacterium]
MNSKIRYLKKYITIGLWVGLVFVAYAIHSGHGHTAGKKKIKKDPREYLWQIHHEVKELGSYENEAFVKREFHTELDGNRENKEEHVVVLIYRVGDRESMLLQVTYFTSKRKGSPVKYPSEIRVISCSLKEDNLEIKHCDYTEKEIESLLPDILQGILNKKEILKLLDKQN